jgi:Xaa-Pro dipeptidase
MPEIHADRRAALREALRERELDALLVVDPLNARYLTGFTGSNVALLVHAGDEPGNEARTVFCTDGRYTEQAAHQVPELERIIERQSPQALLAAANERRTHYARTGYESHHVTVEQLDSLAAAGPALTLFRAPYLVERLRQVKDSTEIDALRMACAAADRALADLLENGGLRAGRSEREVARDLEARMIENGAHGPAFPTILAAGANSAIPHHRPTENRLRDGDLVKIDFGALVDGYHSDMTRTLVLGRPADWQRELYQLVAEAQAAGCAALDVDAEVADVDAAARGVIERAGRGEEFVHGLGHGVGLQIHEAPLIAATGAGTLHAGCPVTVEPGVYLPGRGGVRIEDTLVVGADGPELLTLSTKELLVLD